MSLPSINFLVVSEIQHGKPFSHGPPACASRHHGCKQQRKTKASSLVNALPANSLYPVPPSPVNTLFCLSILLVEVCSMICHEIYLVSNDVWTAIMDLHPKRAVLHPSVNHKPTFLY